MRIGSHVERTDVLAGAARRGADVIQLHLSAPQSWASPLRKPDEDEIRTAGVPVYVHAPYLINPSSVNPALREKSRSSLQQQAAAAARIGALGVVVHGGHPTGNGTVDDAIDGWVDVLRGWTSPVPILIENTAGGHAGPARHVETLARLFDTLRSRTDHTLGFCLDTCHAWAGGMGLCDTVERCRAAAGTVDLVHLNDSKDVAGSGRDRHQNLGAGSIPPSWLVETVLAANAPVVVETPGGTDGQAADIAWLRAQLP